MKKETTLKDLLPVLEDSLSFSQLDSKEQVSKKLSFFGKTGLGAARARQGVALECVGGWLVVYSPVEEWVSPVSQLVSCSGSVWMVPGWRDTL